MNQNTFIKQMLEISPYMDDISDIENFEYLFIQNKLLDYNLNHVLGKDNIILTDDAENDSIYMINSDTINKTALENKTQVKHTPKMDMIMIDDSQAIKENKHLQNSIDQHTIITKLINENIFYIEDSLKEIRIIISPQTKILILGEGIQTDVKHI